jgi:hypothetical protein
MKEEKVKKTVRKHYAEVAKTDGSCYRNKSSCCSTPSEEQISKMIGYSGEEMSNVPEGANLGLECGNPNAPASLKEGERILDMGSGGRFDCFSRALYIAGFFQDKIEANRKQHGGDSVWKTRSNCS